METQEQDQDQDLGNKNNNSSNSYLCRQSSSRWTPTSDQIRILKELYYNNGIRSPTADQIQRIASRLRHFGKIEGKNVFYWFQNHKARERQKKRFTPSQPQPPPPPTIQISPFSDHHHHHLPHFYNHNRKLYTTNHISPPAPEGGSYSSQVFIPVGSATMEKSFMECSISSVESRVTNIHNFGSWVKIMQEEESPEEEEEEEDGGKSSTDQVETLPLFPIHGGASTNAGNDHGVNFNMESSPSSEYSNGGYYTGGSWFRSDARTSLELRLNSYGYYN